MAADHVMPPLIAAQLNYLVSNSPLSVKVDQIWSGCNNGNPNPNPNPRPPQLGDRFTLLIPFCLDYIKWDVLYNAHNPLIPPDIIFAPEDQTFHPLSITNSEPLRKSTFEREMDLTSPNGNKYQLKLEFAYIPLFTSKPFGADPITRECTHLGHNSFWYTTDNYYPEMVCDFFDRMTQDVVNGVNVVEYEGVSHQITMEVIAGALGVATGRTLEQNPKGSQALRNWYREIALRSAMNDGYIKPVGLGKNQFLFFHWLNHNIVPEDKQLNRRQDEYLYTIQKCLELRADRSQV